MTTSRPDLLALIATIIHELTLRGRYFYDEVNAAQHLRETNETVHRMIGHLRDLIDANEPFTSSRAEAIAGAMKIFTSEHSALQYAPE